MLDAYPIAFNIYLVPKLSILTISKDDKGKASIDDILENLIDFND